MKKEQPRKRRKKRKGQPKRKKPANKPKKPPSDEPPPLVLSQTYDGSSGGGVEVQTGDDDMFGDPSVEANERNTRPRVQEDDDDGEDEVDEEPAKQVVVRHARPKGRCSVTWPEGAPAGRRVVEVKMLLTVGKTGRVGKIRVLRSAGEPFDSAARAAMKKCRFSAGTRDGVAFVDRVPFVVEFRPNAD